MRKNNIFTEYKSKDDWLSLSNNTKLTSLNKWKDTPIELWADGYLKQLKSLKDLYNDQINEIINTKANWTHEEEQSLRKKQCDYFKKVIQLLV